MGIGVSPQFCFCGIATKRRLGLAVYHKDIRAEPIEAASIAGEYSKSLFNLRKMP